MKPTLYLRIAAVLTFVHAALHTVGGVFGKPAPGPAQVAVAAMRANHFLVAGLSRTYWDFYRGMGLAVTIFLAIESIVFWQLASLARTGSSRLRPIYASLLVSYLALSVNSGEYFFYGPVIAEILIALCFAAAILTPDTPHS